VNALVDWLHHLLAEWMLQDRLLYSAIVLLALGLLSAVIRTIV